MSKPNAIWITVTLAVAGCPADDAGPSAGDSSTAAAGDEKSCPQGGCDFECRPGDECSFDCEGGDCSLVCQDGEACTLECMGEPCEVTCLPSGATCSIMSGVLTCANGAAECE